MDKIIQLIIAKKAKRGNTYSNIKEQKIIELSKFVGNREFNNFCIEKNMYITKKINGYTLF